MADYQLAPILLFVYNRKDHLIKTIEALKKNELASKSILFIFSDAPRRKKDEAGVNEVRNYINTISGFKNIEIICRKINFGLAKSIIEGVSGIINIHGRVIVLEDDIVVSPSFLNFMNSSLEYYAKNEKVMHISSWSPPGLVSNGNRSYFFSRMMNCWGWATWKESWTCFQKDANSLYKSFSYRDYYRFNLDNSTNLWAQVISNILGNINTWAIFWYASIYRESGLCLNPIKSYSYNIGLDMSGEHCGQSVDQGELNNDKISFLKEYLVEEDKNMFAQLSYYYQKQFNRRLIYFRFYIDKLRVLFHRLKS